MGLFNFFKKKEQVAAKNQNKVLIAMPMYNSGDTFDFYKTIDCLKNTWKCEVADINEEKFFNIDGELVAVMVMPHEIPGDEIKATAQYAYNWPTAEEDLQNHNTHLIVTVMSGKGSDYERFKILTKVLASILETSNCIGVYQGKQSLLTPKEQYLEIAEALKIDKVPIDIWIYLGIRNSDQGVSIYTYGLQSFGKLEMEIINSKVEIEEIHSFLSNICAYVIDSDVTFRNGETLGYAANQKVKLTISKGVFVDGETIKIAL